MFSEPTLKLKGHQTQFLVKLSLDIPLIAPVIAGQTMS